MSVLPAAVVFMMPVVLFLTFWALCYWPLAGVVSLVKTAVKSGSAWIDRSRVGKWATRHAGPVGSYAPILLVIAVGGIAASVSGCHVAPTS